MTAMPLDGMLVADFSRVLAGPLASAGLADLGAEVIKVERPVAGDDTRHWGPPWTDNSTSYFESANRSKRSVELDLDDPTDLDLARRLARRADVVVENFSGDALTRRGLGYADVARTNPGVVYASISGFGPHQGADLPGYDFLVQAVGGLMSITGAADAEPTKVGVALVDVLTAKDTVIGVLAALRTRESTGVGQRIEVNLLSSLLGALANQAAAYLATGVTPGRMGNQHPSIAPYETLHSADGRIAVCCGNDRQFASLVVELGMPELVDDPRFSSNAARVAHRPDLVSVLESALMTDTVTSWATRLNQVGVPAGAVGTIADAIDLADRLGLRPVVDMGPAAVPQVRNPVTYSRTPVVSYAPPPRLGEHNDDVCRWLMEGPTR